MPKLILGYWRLRGYVAPIQYLLEVAGLDYELDLYELGGKRSLFGRSPLGVFYGRQNRFSRGRIDHACDPNETASDSHENHTLANRRNSR